MTGVIPITASVMMDFVFISICSFDESLTGNRNERDLFRWIRNAEGGAALRITPLQRFALGGSDQPGRSLLPTWKNESFVACVVDDPRQRGRYKIRPRRVGF